MTKDEIKDRARQLKTEGAGRSNKAVRSILAEELPANRCPSLYQVSEWCRGLADQRHNRESISSEEAAERKRIYQREYARRRRQDPEYRAVMAERSRRYRDEL
jgi:hypothetical protein